VAVGYGLWRASLPKAVAVVRPERRAVTETITGSGRVAGRRESPIGSQTAGVVAALYVREGDVVSRGEVLARVEDSVSRAQARQAARSLATAHALLEQTVRGPQPSEREVLRARMRQAEAGAAEADAQVNRAEAAAKQADAAVRQALAQQERTESVINQALARYELAKVTLERNRTLLYEGAVPQQTVDQLSAEMNAAEANVAAAHHDRDTARAALGAATAAADAALQDVNAARARREMARRTWEAAQADLRTIVGKPRPEEVTIARDRVREAEAALLAAREQVRSTIVHAPFDGTVTALITELGAYVVPGSGIVQLVQTTLPEIRLNLDEENLPSLRLGQRAVITSRAYPGKEMAGTVRAIGAQVDVGRGTVEVKVTPTNRAPWLRPGQTVDVSLVVTDRQTRLVVPATALRAASKETGGQRTVLALRDGRAVAVPVTAGETDGDTVPVLSGITAEDVVLRDATRVQPGARIRPDAERPGR
jgi:HlyD family secretion protein